MEQRGAFCVQELFGGPEMLFLSSKSLKVISPVIIFLAVYFSCSEFLSHLCPVVKVNVKAMGISGRVSHNDRSAFIRASLQGRKIGAYLKRRLLCSTVQMQRAV